MSPVSSAPRARRSLRVLALIAVFVAVAAGCSCTATGDGDQDTAPVVDPRSGGRLVIGASSPLDDVTPAGREWTPSELQFARGVYDSLAVYDDFYELRPELAKAITPNEDFTDWEIELREDVVFHDGSPLDAAVVQQNLEAQRRSPYAGSLLTPVRSIYVTSPTTVHVRMRAPWSTFPHILTGQPGYIAAPATLADTSGTPRPVGTGPFIAGQLSPEAASLEKNSAYWRDDVPLLDGLEFRVIGDDQERSEALDAGRVDLILTDDPTDLSPPAEPGAAPRQVVLDPEAEDPKLTIVVNTARTPFIDPVARNAVAVATDRTEMVPLRYEGLLAPARTPFIQQSLWYNDVALAPHDLDQARRDVARYQEIYGVPLAFTIAVPAEPIPMRFAAAWQRQLTDAGIVAQVEALPRDEVRDAAAIGAFDAVMLPMWGHWHPDWYYPALHRADMTPVGAYGANYPRSGSLGIDSALDLARKTAELGEQVDQYRNVQDELAAGQAYLFLARWPRAVVAKPDVRDLTVWSTAEGHPGLAMHEGTISLLGVWIDRPERPAE
jgi:peptide/nickel transport system substrate-binding protein